MDMESSPVAANIAVKLDIPGLDQVNKLYRVRNTETVRIKQKRIFGFDHTDCPIHCLSMRTARIVCIGDFIFVEHFPIRLVFHRAIFENQQIFLGKPVSSELM